MSDEVKVGDRIEVEFKGGGTVTSTTPDLIVYRDAANICRYVPRDMNPFTPGWSYTKVLTEPADGGIVVDVGGDAWQRGGDEWWMVGSDRPMSWDALLRVHGPLTVVRDGAGSE